MAGPSATSSPSPSSFSSSPPLSPSLLARVRDAAAQGSIPEALLHEISDAILGLSRRDLDAILTLVGRAHLDARNAAPGTGPSTR